MATLSRRDLELALGFVHQLQDTDGLDAFAAGLLRDLPALVDCDAIGFNEVSPKLNRFHSVVSPAFDNLIEFEQKWLVYQHEHPTYQHILQTGDGTARRISDFLTRGEFFRTGIYAECYRSMDCSAQISLTLDSPPGVVVAVALNRRKGDFSERDRLLLNLLRPHLSRAYVRVEESAALKAHYQAADAALESIDEGLLALDAFGAVTWSTARARKLLLDYAGPSRRHESLPTIVRNWVDQLRQFPALSLAPLVIRAGERSLTIRPLSGRSNGLTLFRLKQHLPVPASPDLFRRMLGLTAREAEVLLSIVHGRTSPEIAIALGCRPRTAQKHTENLFRKLKVSTRTAAVTAAMQVYHDRDGEPVRE